MLPHDECERLVSPRQVSFVSLDDTLDAAGAVVDAAPDLVNQLSLHRRAPSLFFECLHLRHHVLHGKSYTSTMLDHDGVESLVLRGGAVRT